MGYTIVGPPWGSEQSELQDPNWAALYPDLIQSGGLSLALRSLLRQISADPKIADAVWLGRQDSKDPKDGPGPGWAFIRKGSRKSQVSAAMHERAFGVDFRSRGAMCGQGWTRDLTEVARAIEVFMVQEGSTAKMKSEFSWFVDKGGERILQEPTASFTAQCWENLEKGLREEARLLEEEGKPRSIMSELIPLVSEAAKRPELRQLRPFTSLFWLCFSRTTMFPWVTVNCTARPIRDGRFRISNGTWGVNSDGDRVLGEGDAVKAADILAANLPPNCGPAIHGTAEEWEEQEGQ
jgi:hypothetical protein